jgi:CBS domain containing-hemolysin-like protein
MPKVIGVVYSRNVATWMAVPWDGVIRLLSPLIWMIHHSSRLFKPRERVLAAPEEEVQQMAMISAEEGSIMPYEAELVRNVLRLDNLTTRDVMTPRPVVFKLPSDMTLREAAEAAKDWTYSRIPIYAADDPETWEGVAFSRDILAGLAKDQFETKLGSLCVPINFVSEKTAGHVLLETFLKRRTHLFGVMDEYGDITGIVTLEDVLESVIGKEIVDEADTVVDMQEVARRRQQKHFGKSGDAGTVQMPDD